MPTVDRIAAFLEQFAPSSLAESWDNVGLLAGDRQREVRKIMTCLSIADACSQEAVDEQVDLVVTHHPLPFRPLNRLTTDSPQGRLLWRLIGARVSIHSPHTAFDSARGGINQRLAEGLHLNDIVPLVPGADPSLGAGRIGLLSPGVPLDQLAARVKSFLNIPFIQAVGEPGKIVQRVAVACGSAAELLPAVEQASGDCLVTGEARFHASLEAEARGIALLLAGHFASERFGVEFLADLLADQFPDVDVWASRRERDPLRWL